MSELRERLRAAIERGESDVCGCDDHRGPAHDIAADLSIAAVAAWLREVAAESRALAEAATNEGVRDRCRQHAAGLEIAANGIVPPDPEGEDHHG